MSMRQLRWTNAPAPLPAPPRRTDGILPVRRLAPAGERLW